MIETVEQRFKVQADRLWRHTDTPPAFLWPLMFGRHRDDPTLPTGAAKTPVVEVRVNHGVWQTVCPFCDSAQHASETDRRFYCAGCQNEAANHKTLPVKWPRNTEAIHTQLAIRPHRRFRNWEPGETLADLQRQDQEALSSG